MDTIEQINNKLKLDVPLRLKGVFKKRKETLEEFLIKFFEKFNQEKNTIYVKNRKLQTEPGRRRSFGDIYRICQYYYPECTVKEVSDLLYKVLPKKINDFRSSKCSQIHKRVFYKGYEGEGNEIYEVSEKDEFGLKVNDWKKL